MVNCGAVFAFRKEAAALRLRRRVESGVSLERGSTRVGKCVRARLGHLEKNAGIAESDAGEEQSELFHVGRSLVRRDVCCRRMTNKRSAERQVQVPFVALSIKYTPSPNCRSSFMKPRSVTVSMSSAAALQNNSVSLESGLVTGHLSQRSEMMGSKRHGRITAA